VLARHCVLIVDDNADTVSTLAQLVSMLGHEVHTASDGATGLRKALECKPDVVFLDIGLPGLDGHEVARSIRANPITAKAKIIVMSGSGRLGDDEASLQSGADQHLIKPVDFQFIESILGKLVPR
jgi:two-component system, sensor histidine kinase